MGRQAGELRWGCAAAAPACRQHVSTIPRLRLAGQLPCNTWLANARPLPLPCLPAPPRSGAKIAGIEADMQQLVRSEAARAAEEQAQQAAAATAAAAAETPAAAAAQQAAGAVRSGSAANAVVPAASMRVGRDGSLAFHFDTTAAGSQASALELARQRLAAQLPREAAASLERSLHRQQAASGMRYRRRRAELAETERQLVGAGAGAVEAAAGGGGPGGAHGTAATAVRHALAARVDTLRREVASEALQASRLAEDLEGLLSLHTSGHGGASLSSGSSAAAGAGAAAGRHAFASTGAVPQAARPATPDPVLRGSFAGELPCLLLDAWHSCPALVPLVLLLPTLILLRCPALQASPSAWRPTAPTQRAACCGAWRAPWCRRRAAAPPTLPSGWPWRALRPCCCPKPARLTRLASTPPSSCK